MSNFDITELLTDGRRDRRMNGQTKGKAGTLSQSQKVREMFQERFDGCLVL